MPDWTYRTVFRPVLSRLKFQFARRFVLGSLGGLGRTGCGRAVIGWMGHMVPDSRLQTEVGPVSLRSPTIISCDLDPNQQAVEALGQFGSGLVEVGVYRLEEVIADSSEIHSDETAIQTVDADLFDWKTGRLLSEARGRSWRDDRERIRRAVDCGVPIAMRISLDSLEGHIHHADQLAIGLSALQRRTPFFAAYVFSLMPTRENLKAICSAVAIIDQSGVSNKPSWLRVSLEALPWFIEAVKEYKVESLGAMLVDPGNAPAPSTGESKSDSIARTKAALGSHRIAVHSGFREPADAVECLAAGASMVAVDSSLAHSGPGFIKRINAGELHRRMLVNNRSQSNQADTTNQHRVPSWIWAVLLGLSMFLGGWLTMYLGVIGVMLPYDEVYLGMTSRELYAKAPRLLRFMAHDRVTLAGTMIAIGLCYAMLGWFGIRRGMHWPMMTILWSSAVGFASFFLFLLFGYFDPLHAFVSAVLLQLALQMVQSPIQPKAIEQPTCVVDDMDWKTAQWGQLLLVVQAAGLLAAGAAIAALGSTQVFVREDLAYLQMNRSEIEAIHPRLVGIIAHDRAAFGGMLLSVGAVVLYCAMWGFERGRAWLWWMLFVGGTLGYMTTIVVHGCVGYTDFRHLLPANLGLIELWVALSLSTRYLCMKSPDNQAGWRRILEAEAR